MAPWGEPPVTPAGLDPELEPMADGGRPWPHVSRDLEANHQSAAADQPGKTLVAAAWKPPAGGSRNLQPSDGAPLRFARSAQPPGELPGAGAPAARQTTSWWLLGMRAAASSILENRKAAGRVALLPQRGELIVPEAGRPGPWRNPAGPGDPSRQVACPGSRDLSSFCPVAGAPVGAPPGRLFLPAFHWNW